MPVDSFAAMMAMSQAQTAAKQSAVEAMAAERKRKEQEARKRQIEQEKKRKEEEAKLRLKHFEDQKREAERQKQREGRKKAIEEERLKREEAQRNALLYGPKKASSSSKYPSSSSQTHTREEVRKQRLPSDDEEDDVPKGEILTRQEIRERKLQQRLRREFTTAKRSTSTGAYQKPGRRLPGGAVDVTTAGRPQLESGSGSVRQRLAAMPNTLQPLNQNKRDTRTIDEIVNDLHTRTGKKRTIEGEQAKEFDDWFGTKSKQKEKSRPGSSAPDSGANTPKSSHANGTSTPSFSSAAQRPSNAMIKPIPKATPSMKNSAARPSTNDRDRSDKASSSKGKNRTPNITRPNSAGPSTSHIPSKRSRSPTRSESPYSKRRAYDDYDSEALDEDDEADMGGEGSKISNLIWGIMGKNRSRYMDMDVFSDDEDMEAGASDVEREEMRSSRIAKREDAIAKEEERRHEEEKKRRKKERERSERY